MAKKVSQKVEEAKRPTKGSIPRTLGELAASAAPYNPRKIGSAAAAGLQRSMREFGDLSGIVINLKTGNLVAGHQRTSQLSALAKQAGIRGDLPIRQESKTRGVVEFKLDDRTLTFPVRYVDWSEEKEKAANVVANNPHISGEFTKDLKDLLADIKGFDDKLFAGTNLDELLFDVAELDTIEGGGNAGYDSMFDGTGEITEDDREVCPHCGRKMTAEASKKHKSAARKASKKGGGL